MIFSSTTSFDARVASTDTMYDLPLVPADMSKLTSVPLVVHDPNVMPVTLGMLFVDMLS